MVPMSRVDMEISDVIENKFYVSLETKVVLTGIRNKIRNSDEML